MEERLEVLLSSENTGLLWNMCVWDASTGSSLKSYKGHSTKAKTATFLGNSYLISSQSSQPLLNVWQINRHEQKVQKYTTPGVLESLAGSPCGHFLIGTNEERIYVWQTASGKLLKIITSGHYQKIKQVRFTSDGSHFVTAGEDGNTLLWAVDNVVNQSPDKCKPRHVWNHHSLGVSDFHLGFGGLQSRIFTCSKDQTAKVYCVSSGQYLMNIEFPLPLTSIAIDSAEESGFVGTTKGLIYTFSLKSAPRDLKLSIDGTPDNTFRGHTNTVTCLSVSLDGSHLASGSEDKDVRLWHVKSRQCLKLIPHKGTVTTLIYMVPKPGMLKPEDYKEKLTFSQLEKTAIDKQTLIKNDLYSLNILCPKSKFDDRIEEPSARELLKTISENATKAKRNQLEVTGDADAADPSEIKRLKTMNQKLYEAALKAILNDKGS